MIFFHLLSRVKLFFFSEKVGISQNCILTLLSTFLLFFFSEFILIIKNFPTFFCLVRKNEFHPWKKFISLNSIHEKIYFLTCFVTRCIMYFFMYEADWKHFFLAETFFFMGIFLCVCVCWAECKTFGFFWPLYVFSDRTDWERGSDTQQTAPGQDLNPGLLQWGQSLCAWDETEPHIILILIQRL